MIKPSRLSVFAAASQQINPDGVSGTFLLNMDDESAEVQFTISTMNWPKGSLVSFSSDTPGPNPPIVLTPTIVSTYPSFTTGIMSSVPGNFIGTINYTVQLPAGATLPLGVSVKLEASQLTQN